MGWACPDKVARDGETLKPPELWFLHILAERGSCEDRLAAVGFSGLALLKSSTSRTSPGD